MRKLKSSIKESYIPNRNKRLTQFFSAIKFTTTFMENKKYKTT